MVQDSEKGHIIRYLCPSYQVVDALDNTSIEEATKYRIKLAENPKNSLYLYVGKRGRLLSSANSFLDNNLNTVGRGFWGRYGHALWEFEQKTIPGVVDKHQPNFAYQYCELLISKNPITVMFVTDGVWRGNPIFQDYLANPGNLDLWDFAQLLTDNRNPESTDDQSILAYRFTY